ncbi:MAG: hypothetical protein HKO84_01080 [Pseudomonadales bacterium]|nr:hypothetical protein [Pseudomonadales bacterium]
MQRFYVVLVGDNILLEQGGDYPIAGFVAPRCVRGQDSAQAVQLAKIQLLKDWKLTFNRDNKAGTPRLEVAAVEQIKNPFKRLSNSQHFEFFGIDEERQAKTKAAIAAFQKWFRIR